jgi:hypothetical protein
MMTIMRMHSAILTIAYSIYAIFTDSVISEGLGDSDKQHLSCNLLFWGFA